MEAFVVEAIVNHDDAFARQTEEFHNICGSVFADRDDSILPLGKPPDDNAPIKHSFPVIFFGDMKWREVVNCGDKRAWSPPKHPAIARNVENIELQFADELRQSRLMPKNAFHRRTKLFRHSNDL